MSTQTLNHKNAIFWGEFLAIADATYSPGITNPAQPAEFPKNWSLIKNINVEPVVSFIKQREFIGFLAQSLDEPVQLAVVLHGSISILDFIDDMEFALTDFERIENGGKTEYGFTRLYESISFVDPADGTTTSLQDYLSNLASNRPSVTVAGHSLGAALSVLHSVVLASHNIPVTVYGFAPPMVGDVTFTNTYNSLVPDSYLIVNRPDIVPKLPAHCLGYEQVHHVYDINSSDFPAVKRNLVCFHMLESYLYTLRDGKGYLGACHT